MKILHIIPAAFEYFNDIKDRAMALVDQERRAGLDSSAFTLQYGTVGKSDHRQARQVAPTLSFTGLFGKNQVLEEMKEADLIHLHTPFLGMAKDILKWKKENSAQPLMVSYWRKTKTNDLFSFFLKIYNHIYLPKIFLCADAVINHAQNGLPNFVLENRSSKTQRIFDLSGTKRNIHLTGTENGIEYMDKTGAEACLSIYRHFLK